MREKADTLTYTPPLEKILEDSVIFSPGDPFGARYRIVEEIGRGGMGCVYKAEDKELDMPVALKMIRPSYSSDPGFIQSFKKETRLARSVTHENVIRIHDLGEVGDIKFISMDYVKGQDLKDLIHASGYLSVETAINLTRQICEGLNAAHQKKIIHLDLKPRNIMVDHDGMVRIMDFGVSRSLEGHRTEGDKKVIGTPAYISPEQAKGEGMDQRSDIYSLGVIIFEMLTGKRPFEADTVEGYIEQHLHKKPTNPSKFNPLISPSLAAIILKCLEKDKSKRYQNTSEILADIKEYEKEARLSSTRIKPKKSQRFIYPLLFILFIVSGLYWLFKQKEPTVSIIPESGKIPLVVMFFENHTGEDADDEWRMGLCDLVIRDLLDSKYIKVLPGDSLFTVIEDLDLTDKKNYSSEDLKKVALRGGADHLLYGTYHKAEDRFRINVYLKNIISGKILNERFEGKGEGTFFDAADDITRWVKLQLNITASEIASDPDKNIRDIFTGSPVATKLYIQGKQSYYQGDYQKSNEILEKAVEIDDGFALAYRQISENYHYLGYIEQSQEYARKALSLKDRFSERDGYLITGWAYTILEESFKKAEKVYIEMLQEFPDDEDANIYLGATYRNMEEWDLAQEIFEKIFNVNPGLATDNLLIIFKAKGEYDEAVEFVETRIQNIRDQDNKDFCRGMIHLYQKKYDLARLELERALSSVGPENPSADMAADLMGLLSYLQDDFQKAEVYFTSLLEKEAQPSIASFYQRLWLIGLFLAQGQYEESLRALDAEIEKASKNDMKSVELGYRLLLAYVNLGQDKLEEALEAAEGAERIATEIKFRKDKLAALRLIGYIQLRMNRTADAKKTAKRLKDYLDILETPKFMRYYYHLEGMIAQHAHDSFVAVEEFKRAVSLLPYQYDALDDHAFFFSPMAGAYYELEEWDKAQMEFERITQLTSGRILWGDLYAKSYYWLGKIHQKKNEREKAGQNYEKFLRLWKDADPGIPEVEDARKQLHVVNED
jgi:serine/threonine protein kinase/Tfp pilus assembly protein PilF